MWVQEQGRSKNRGQAGQTLLNNPKRPFRASLGVEGLVGVALPPLPTESVLFLLSSSCQQLEKGNYCK